MDEMKIGMVGLDTSHCEAFVKRLHGLEEDYSVAGARVVGAYPGGTEMCAVSSNRVGKYTELMRDTYGIPIVGSIEELGEGMDAFLLESVDGRQHVEQFEVLAGFGKPVFIDKPMACSAADARAIIDISRAKAVPIMSASSLRYSATLVSLAQDGERKCACDAFGRMPILDDYPTYFWYGIHATDVLFSLMGKGCESVRTIHAEETDVLIGRWTDGRVGTVRGARFGKCGFGCTAFTESGVMQAMAGGEPPEYYLLMEAVVEFFRTSQEPIDVEETWEIMAFLEAAGESLARHGAAVPLRK